MAANAAEQAHMVTVMACMLGALLQKLERVKYKTGKFQFDLCLTDFDNGNAITPSTLT